jgi:hypothetical protein
MPRIGDKYLNRKDKLNTQKFIAQFWVEQTATHPTALTILASYLRRDKLY